MKIPTLQEANLLLEEAKGLHPGVWVGHSLHVAQAAKLIAEKHPGLDAEVAYIFGLLHDIGRRAGETQMRHIIDGYHFLQGKGYDDAARICLTHTFSYKNINGIYGQWDCSGQELAFIEEYLDAIEYNDYDLLIQLCDSLALASGFTLIEKRMVNTALKFGVNPYTVAKWKAVFDIKVNFEKGIGYSIYSLLPGVVENTFEMK